MRQPVIGLLVLGLATSAWAAPPVPTEPFTAAKAYAVDKGQLVVELGRPTLFSSQNGQVARHALHVPLRVRNRLGRTVTLERGSTTLLDRLDHPLADPAVFRDGKPVPGDPEIGGREEAVLHLFFDTAQPELLDRFDLHWSVADRQRTLQEITHYRAARPVVEPRAPVAEPMPGPEGQGPSMSGPPSGPPPAPTASGTPSGPPSDPVQQAVSQLATYHLYRDMLHGDILGSSLTPPSGLPFSQASVTARQLPLEIDVLGF